MTWVDFEGYAVGLLSANTRLARKFAPDKPNGGDDDDAE